MKKRALTLLTIGASLLVFGSALTGCSDNFKGLTINFWHTFGKTPADSIAAKAATFAKLVKENEGVSVRIKFTYKGSYDDVLSNMTKGFAVGETPTIAVAYPDQIGRAHV